MVNLPAAWPLMEPGLKWNFFLGGGGGGGVGWGGGRLTPAQPSTWRTFFQCLEDIRH